jgi:hypothetical protein
MARVHALKTTFTSGELDPLLQGRMDLKAYRNGADKMRNVVVQPQGGFRRRPGLQHLELLPYQLSSASFSGWTVTMANDSAATVGNLTDDDESTLASTTALGATDNFVIFQIDFVATTPDYLDIINVGLNTGSVNLAEEVRLQDSDDASAWVTVEHVFSSISATKRTYRLKLNGKRYVRLIRIGTTNTAAAFIEIDELYAWNENSSVSPVRLAPFEFSITQTYLLAFTDLNCRVFKDGVRQADIPTPWADADLVTTDPDQGIQTIVWEQDLDTLLVTHPDYQPRSIQRSGADDEWQPALWTLSNIPEFDFGAGAEAVWSATRGWPSSCTFFQGRLWFGGSKSRPQTLWASKSGDFHDFDTSATDDDFGIDVTLDSSGVVAIWNIYPGRHFQIFTSSAEFYLPTSDSAAVTPTNIVARRNSSRGSKRGIPVVEVDGSTAFVQRGGKTYREFLFTDTEQAYAVLPLSLLSSHLFIDPVGVALRKAISTDEADYIWVVNNDGTLATFCTLRSQEVAAWTLCTTDGNFKAAAVVLDTSYFAVERTINSVAGLYLEQFNSDLEVDAGSFDWALSVDTGSVAGLTHLAGETADVVLDGSVQAQLTVSTGGTVTFARDAENNYQVGLPFPDATAILDTDDADYASSKQMFVRTLTAEEALPEGTQMGRKKRIVDCTVRMRDSSHVIVNGNEVPFRAFGASLLDVAPPSFTGDKRVPSILGWSEQGSVRVSQNLPLPLNVLALAYKLGV